MTDLYKHQHYALQRAKHSNLALFHDCGCGKTRTAIEIIRHHGGRALVVCPLTIIDAAWIEDVKKFAPELSVVSLHSKKPCERLQRLEEDHHIYVVNYESFRSKELYRRICAKGFTTLVVDESSRIKDPKSLQTMSLLTMAGITPYGAKKKGYLNRRPIPHRYILSGTPAPNKEIEYWPQIKFVTGPGNIVFNDNFYAFRGAWFADRYATRKVKFQDWYLPTENRQSYIDKMAPWCDVVSKADAVDLPAQVHEKRIIELSPQEQKSYNTFKDELVLLFGDSEILASNALTEIMKLRQLTSGFAYTEDGVIETGRSKLKELSALVQEIGDKPVIIWANFKHEIQALLEALPNSEALWSGTKDRNNVIRNFQNGITQYLIANPQSAGHGLTFINCNDMIYFSLNYSFELLKQSQDRVHRIGQSQSCTYYYIMAKGTIDEVIYRALTKKEALSATVLSHLKGISL
jgi:SNF2 family DNA or RNA helicase